MEKRLYRIEEGKKVCGVCGGIAEYFNIDLYISSFRTGITTAAIT